MNLVCTSCGYQYSAPDDFHYRCPECQGQPREMVPREKIFIDLDGTIVDLISDVCHEVGWHRPVLNYDLRDIPENLRNKIFGLFADMFFTGAATPIPGARDAIRDLSRDYDVYGLTVRAQNLIPITRAYCELHFPEMKGVLFTKELGMSKAEVCNKYKAFAFIDDCPTYVQDIVDNNAAKYIFLVSNDRTVYNWKWHYFWGNRVIPVEHIRNMRKHMEKK